MGALCPGTAHWGLCGHEGAKYWRPRTLPDDGGRWGIAALLVVVPARGGADKGRERRKE